MRMLFGFSCLVVGLLFLGQLVSILNMSLAQRLGLQESADHTDPLSSHLELWAARWDVAWLWVLPVAGVLMLLGHWFWPYAALIGGGAAIDTGGREAAKVLGLKEEGVRIGSTSEIRLAFAVYVFLIATGCLAIGIGLTGVL